MKKNLFFTFVFAMLFVSCAPAPTATPTPTSIPTAEPTVTPTPVPVFTLSSPAFANGETIPTVHTCSGDGISPELTWNEPPAGTKSFALIMDDPDASGFTHWIIYNIPADRRGLAEDIETGRELEDGIFQGLNGVAVFGYMGSCPPALHHYSFRLYALDTLLDMNQGAGKMLLVPAMEGHILAQSELIGTFAP